MLEEYCAQMTQEVLIQDFTLIDDDPSASDWSNARYEMLAGFLYLSNIYLSCKELLMSCVWFDS